MAWNRAAYKWCCILVMDKSRSDNYKDNKQYGYHQNLSITPFLLKTSESISNRVLLLPFWLWIFFNGYCLFFELMLALVRIFILHMYKRCICAKHNCMFCLCTILKLCVYYVFERVYVWACVCLYKGVCLVCRFVYVFVVCVLMYITTRAFAFSKGSRVALASLLRIY